MVVFFNFSCRTIQIQKKNSRFAVGNSQPASMGGSIYIALELKNKASFVGVQIHYPK